MLQIMNTDDLSSLASVDLLLSEEVGYPDGWHDCLEEIARAKIRTFTDEEWENLGRLWSSKDELWQLKLVGILGAYNFGQTVPILESMIRHSSPKVVREALYALEGMDGDEGYTYVPDKEVLGYLDTIYSKAAYSNCRKVIEWLKQRPQ